ncbi:tetratricopeptide repeat protein [Cytophagaceae bacterium YF14B1]|uniref:Tetratricopeptide repeat protein n=1 Tax=Xanthocytophaga flava TaxID=3048013 RepID=A0AAE3QYW1_9BACT|nr:tetratricopeptide repeat protein [Xanthocytophaga flavus]MDJ1485289.1 tetratricopeptide repeat protein [Xanthocytophaga flavus]
MGSIIFSACSQYSKGPVSVAYHDLNSHYNAYFLANERLTEAEKVLFSTRKDDYNEMLAVLIAHDTVRAGTVKTQTTYAIEKASLPVQYHKNSNWLDDCYFQLARARFLQADFENAIQTYKYVNSESKDDALRQRAMIGLLRSFTELKNYDYASAVISRLRKDKLSKHDLVDFYEARASYHQVRQEYDQTLAVLKQTVKRMRAGERRARMYYIIGQLYQRNNRPKDAYANFERVMKSNASYELALQAQLKMIQMYAGKDERKLLKQFNKLLHDEKNKEYQGRILYAIGMYEYRKDRLDKAIDYFSQSSQAKGTDNRQKALAFLKLAEIYYEKQQNYQAAKNYYDSTFNAGLPKSTPDYDVIAKRHKVLDDFVRHYTIIQTEDSLQRIVKMDDATRSKFFDEVIDKQEKQEQEAEDKKNSEIAKEVGAIFDNLDIEKQSVNNTNDVNWYFSNPTAVAQGRTSFIRKWGNRKLEDNWRRGQKDATIAEDQPTQDSNDSQPVVTEKPKKPSREEQKKNMLAKLPMAPEDIEKSNEKIEEAYYELGKILDKELLEKKNAIKDYETLLERFPSTEHAAEVLYAMFLIYQELGDEQQNTVKNRLLTQYPTTLYAKLVSNPNYTRDENLADIQADRAFQEAYQLYEAQNFAEADQLVQSGLQQYAGTLNEQRFKVLQIKIVGKTQGLEAYRKALQDFVAAYPQSKLLPYVQNLLQKTDEMGKSSGNK